MSRVRTVFDFGFLWNCKSVFTHSTAFIGLYKFHCAQGPLISFQELLRSHVWINKFIFQMPGVFFFVRVWFVGSSDGIKKLQMLHKHQLPGLCCEIRYFSNSFSTLRHSFNYLFIYPFIHFTYVYSFKGQAWVSVGESNRVEPWHYKPGFRQIYFVKDCCNAGFCLQQVVFRLQDS